jgi:hypothetical protein
MKKVFFFAMLAYGVSIASCSTFKYVKPVIEQSELSPECENLVPLIKSKWKKHRKKNFYEGEDDFLTVIQRDYRRCITSLTKTEIIKLFGQPAEDDPDFAFYFLNETCLQSMPENCQTLIFYFKDDNKKVYEYLLQPYGYLEEKK